MGLKLYCRTEPAYPPRAGPCGPPLALPPSEGGTTKSCSVAVGNLPVSLFAVGGRPPHPPNAAFGRKSGGFAGLRPIPRFWGARTPPRPPAGAFGRKSGGFSAYLQVFSVLRHIGRPPYPPNAAFGRKSGGFAGLRLTSRSAVFCVTLAAPAVPSAVFDRKSGGFRGPSAHFQVSCVLHHINGPRSPPNAVFGRGRLGRVSALHGLRLRPASSFRFSQNGGCSGIAGAAGRPPVAALWQP
jgi:hypothetical protein